MKLLNKKSIGLDIADRTIELAEIERSDSGFKVLNLINRDLPAGVVEGGRIKNGAKLADAIQSIFSETKSNALSSRKIIFGLPESQVFLRNFTLGTHDKNNRDQLVLREASQSIPLKEGEFIHSYRVLSETVANTKLLIAAANRSVIKEWVDFFENINIEVSILDIEALAVFRGLFAKSPEKPVCVIDIGSRTANICVFDQAGLRYSFPSFIAGNSFTEAIARVAQSDFTEAEQLKIEAGLSAKDDKIVAELKGEIDKLVTTIKETFEYYSKETGGSVSEIILVGGSSQMAGLAGYLSDALHIGARIGASRFQEAKAPLIYIEAIGLAIRGLDSFWDERDPSFPVRLENEKEKPANLLRAKEEIVLNTMREVVRNKQLLLLISILILGAILLAGALWFRTTQRKIRAGYMKIQYKDTNTTSPAQTTAISATTTEKIAATSTIKSEKTKK